MRSKGEGATIDAILILAGCCLVLSVLATVSTMVLPLMLWKLFGQEQRVLRLEQAEHERAEATVSAVKADVKQLDEVVDRMAGAIGLNGRVLP